MRAIMIMFDTLSRKFLSTYGGDTSLTPNFKRLENRCTVFDNFYSGSLPCMPARRELHTGRYNFMHRGWGPLEPFDHSVIEQLKENGIYTHLVTDHSHYFEDGGATYHNRYHTWEGFRGQEGDRWQPQAKAVKINENPLNKEGISVVQHYANRTKMMKEEDMPSVKTMTAGLEFLDFHKDRDNWFLQIECFDPHEPFFVPETYRQFCNCIDEKDTFYWPPYTPLSADMTEEQISNLRKEYCALIHMCDHYLGKILDTMDRYHMWEDTMLIVNTDHGFLLGERGLLGKNYMPMYDEIAHIPFFIYDPRNKDAKGRRKALAQTIDIAPTLAEFFGISMGDTDGCSLTPVIKEDKIIHDGILYGVHGGHTQFFDGKYILMKAPNEENAPLINLTLMPTNMRGFYGEAMLKQGELQQGSRFTNQVPVMKYFEKRQKVEDQYGDLIFDMEQDPEQKNKIDDENLKKRLCKKMEEKMKSVFAPEEEFIRLGLRCSI